LFNPLKSAGLIGIGLLFILTGTALCEDRAVLIGAGEYASGKWGLPLVTENVRLVEKALLDEVGIPAENVRRLIDRDVTKTGVWRAISEATQKIESGSRFFLYYTGHASKVTVEGAPVRAYFTWDTMEGSGGDGFEPATLITDVDLKNWIRPLKQKGVFVVIIREACFSGGGYAQDISKLSPGRPPVREPAGDIEISACDVDQSAWALEGAEPPVALFTAALCKALGSDQQRITAKKLFDSVYDRVSGERKGQTPILDHGKATDPERVLLVDRTVVDLLVEARDAITGESLSDAKVVLNLPGGEDTWEALTPNTRLEGIPRHAMLFPWIEKKGYVPVTRKVAIPPKARVVKSEIQLEPEVAEVKGKIKLVGKGTFSGIRIAFESGSRPLSPRHVDTEVRPESDGSFTLRVPAHGPCRLMVVQGAESLATVELAEGKNLKPVRYFDREKKDWVGKAYKVGTIDVTLPERQPERSEADRAFESYFRLAQDAEEGGRKEDALRNYQLARDAAAMVQDGSRKKELASRVGKAISRIEEDLKSAEYETLVGQAQKAGETGDLDRALSLAQKAVAINPQGVMANLLLKDLKVRASLAGGPPASTGPSIERAAPKTTNVSVTKGKGFNFVREETFSCAGVSHSVKIYRHQMTGLEFVLVPGGTFKMGSDSSDPDYMRNEKPKTEITIEPFLICRTEVTQAVWTSIMGESPWHEKKNINEGADYPATYVSWKDCVEFSDKTGLRLPSESEWEYACRAGTSAPYCFGNAVSELPSFAWYRDSVKDPDEKHPHQVGRKKTNAFGLYDVHGNVWEWCRDTESRTHNKVPLDGTAREDRSVQTRVLRGGSWSYAARQCRCAARLFKKPTSSRTPDLGFRPAADLP